MTDYVYSDADTLGKVRDTIVARGLYDEIADRVIIDLQNAGILFRERFNPETTRFGVHLEKDKGPEDVKIDPRLLNFEWEPKDEKVVMRVMADFYTMAGMISQVFPESREKDHILEMLLEARNTALKTLLVIPRRNNLSV